MTLRREAIGSRLPSHLLKRAVKKGQEFRLSRRQSRVTADHPERPAFTRFQSFGRKHRATIAESLLRHCRRRTLCREDRAARSPKLARGTISSRLCDNGVDHSGSLTTISLFPLHSTEEVEAEPFKRAKLDLLESFVDQRVGRAHPAQGQVRRFRPMSAFGKESGSGRSAQGHSFPSNFSGERSEKYRFFTSPEVAEQHSYHAVHSGRPMPIAVFAFCSPLAGPREQISS